MTKGIVRAPRSATPWLAGECASDETSAGSRLGAAPFTRNQERGARTEPEKSGSHRASRRTVAVRLVGGWLKLAPCTRCDHVAANDEVLPIEVKQRFGMPRAPQVPRRTATTVAASMLVGLLVATPESSTMYG